MEITVATEAGIGQAAREFIAAAAGRRHIAFDAPMGAGKTTFISALCRELGVDDDVNSPTFSIINEYRDGEGRAVGSLRRGVSKLLISSLTAIPKRR